MAARRGAFILFEGADRCGKSTQVQLLVKNLAGRGVATAEMRSPDRNSVVGKICGEYLQKSRAVDDHAVHLLFSANRWECRVQLEEHLNAGRTVIMDRYCYSGVAYSMHKAGMTLEWCKRCDAGLPAPDIVFHLHVPLERAMARGGFGGEIYEKEEIQRHVMATYDAFAETEPNWVKVDADRPVEAIAEELLERAAAVVERAADAPLGTIAW